MSERDSSSAKIHPAVAVTRALESSDLSKISSNALFVPPGEHFLKWHQKNNSDQKFTGGADTLLSNNTILSSWLSVNNIAQLVPSTLIPIGVLVLLFNMFLMKHPKAAKKVSKQQTGGGDSLEQHPLVREWTSITKTGGVKAIVSPTSLVPFALVLGRDVLKATLNSKTKGT